jgi:Haem-degrading
MVIDAMKPLLLSPLCTVLLAAQVQAQGLLPTHRISADLANQAVAAAVAKCASEGYAETAVLVDADGVQQALLRGDRAGAHTLDSAFSKAFTAASFKTGTSALVERSKIESGVREPIQIAPPAAARWRHRHQERRRSGWRARRGGSAGR